MTRRQALAALLLLGSLVLPGCGTILGLSSDREVFVVTNPSGATLYKNGIPTTVLSPTPVGLDPGEEWRIDARLDDLKGGSQVTRSRRIGVVIADVIFTAGLGLWIDYLSGAMYYFPERVILNLGRSQVSPLAGGEPAAAPDAGRLDPNAPDPVAADPAWPPSGTGGPPPSRGGESSTRDLLGTTKQR